MQRLSSDLKHKKCVPCEGGIAPLTPGQYESFLRQELHEWSVRNEQFLEKEYVFKNFKQVLGFVNKVGALAEEEGHHPDIFIHDWNKLKLSLTTFAIGGLSENDFILASKIDELK